MDMRYKLTNKNYVYYIIPKKKKVIDIGRAKYP